MNDRLEQARAVADAVLYEGYLLYPYRASARKNQAQTRWQFGVLVPPAYAEAGTGEHDQARTECLVEPGADATVALRVRFLQVQARQVQRRTESGEHEPVESLSCQGNEYVTWDEAVECERDVVLPVGDVLEREQTVRLSAPAGTETEELPDGAGRMVRERQPVEAEVRCIAETLPGPYGVLRLRMVLANVSTWDASTDDGTTADRQAALRRSLVAAHTVLALTGARFLSMLEPPEWAKVYVHGCVNEHTWPVLLGAPGDQDAMLSSPIILYDYPEIAPESDTAFYDATEMDEMLTLRTLTMTEEEKRQARATDDRAAGIVDRVGDVPTELLDRLHGAVRYLRPVRRDPEPEPQQEAPWWDPGADESVSPESDSVVVDGVPVAKGSTVLLRPGTKRADAQDMFLDGRTATVAAVMFDVDGETHIAVTVEDDPAAELQLAHGRYRYFAPTEIEPVGI